MYRQKEYIQLLKQKFSKTDIINAKNYKSKYEKEIKEIPNKQKTLFDVIIQKSKEIYGFDLTKVYTFNYVKYYLWRKEFCKNDDDDWKEAALSFVCLSCLSDLIFDSKRLEEREKQHVANILTRDYFQKSISIDMDMTTEDPIDILYSMFVKHMKRLKEYNFKVFLELQTDILNAFESEIYISTNKLVFPEKINIDLITSKSIEFVSSCLYLSAVDTQDSVRMKKCAVAIAKLFWLVDDLCDLYDDIENQIKNSILFLQNGEVKNLENSIDFVFENLDTFFEVIEENLEVLKNNLSDDVYIFFLYELYDWVEAVNVRMDDKNESIGIR